ncbi:hypothetical protein AB0M34_16835 [Nocardia sp. NPDC050193]
MSVLRRAAAGCAAGPSLIPPAACTGSGEPASAPAGAIPLVSTGDLPAAGPGEVHLFGFSDPHGHLEPPEASNGLVGEYTASGAAYLATHLDRLRAAYPDSAVLSAGDNVAGVVAVPRRADGRSRS